MRNTSPCSIMQNKYLECNIVLKTSFKNIFSGSHTSLAFSLCLVNKVIVIFSINKFGMSQIIQNERSAKFHLYGVWECDFHLNDQNDNSKSKLDSTRFIFSLLVLIL